MVEKGPLNHRILRFFNTISTGNTTIEVKRSILAFLFLPGLYKSVEYQGVDRLEHRDLILKAPESDKRYVITATPRKNERSTLEITDFQPKNGRERIMVFTYNPIFQSVGHLVRSRKLEANRPLNTYMQGQYTLSPKEKLDFLKEVLKAEVDLDATQELVRKDLVAQT